jgi:hypothetical protein
MFPVLYVFLATAAKADDVPKPYPTESRTDND